jgi:hypothetical protein
MYFYNFLRGISYLRFRTFLTTERNFLLLFLDRKDKNLEKYKDEM